MSEIIYRCPGCGSFVKDTNYPEHLKSGHASGIESASPSSIVTSSSPPITPPKMAADIGIKGEILKLLRTRAVRNGLMYWTLIILLIGYVLGRMYR